MIKRTYFTEKTYALFEKEDGLNWTTKSNYSEIESLVMEYAIAKICAAMKVGVAVGSTDHNFDLVCYDDCIEFYMERCHSIQKRVFDTPIFVIEERLKKCLSVMHHFGLVHKDIKPDNLLSNDKGQIFLADFGLSIYLR